MKLFKMNNAGYISAIEFLKSLNIGEYRSKDETEYDFYMIHRNIWPKSKYYNAVSWANFLILRGYPPNLDHDSMLGWDIL